jgi:hypothetical protein
MEEGYSEASPTRRPIIHVDASRAPALAPFHALYAAERGSRSRPVGRRQTRDSAPWRLAWEDQVVGTLQTSAMPNAPVTAQLLAEQVAEGAVAILGHHRPVVVVARMQAEDVASVMSSLRRRWRTGDVAVELVVPSGFIVSNRRRPGMLRYDRSLSPGGAAEALLQTRRCGRALRGGCGRARVGSSLDSS